ncbi:MAG: S8 family serine peptidase [Flavobacteriales bacterium]|nr:S8 family serine peptidase [Flavobacteriales bacterium]
MNNVLLSLMVVQSINFRVIFTYILLLVCCTTDGQDAYWVFFNDKCTNKFNPHEYFTEKAIQRRLKHNLPLYDHRDLPVCKNYVAQVSDLVDSVGYTTRWLNGVVVFCSAEKIEYIKHLDIVKITQPMNVYQSALAQYDPEIEESFTEELLRKQVERMGVTFFKKEGLTGKGIIIAVFDAGFPTVNTNKAFEHIRRREGILATYDFVKRKENVFAFNAHGTNVLSCIGGKKEGKRIGMATGADFLLARTENAHREPFSEEQNWLKAVEWADKNGADIINSSLAYTYSRYFSWEMDGQVSLVARAANIAASKGILVVSAAGNDGDKSWKYIGTPGDADSALTVGGIDPNTDYHIDFSSYGPTQDKRMKPNVTAFGEVAVQGKTGLTISQGTSFSSPLVAGFAACILENDTTLHAMELYREIEKSGHLYPYFDYAHGFGIPQAGYFLDSTNVSMKPTFEFEKGKIMLSVKISQDSSIFDENLIFYHVENTRGYLDRYYVISADEEYPIRLYLDEFKKGQIVRVHYKGYTESYYF